MTRFLFESEEAITKMIVEQRQSLVCCFINSLNKS